MSDVAFLEARGITKRFPGVLALNQVNAKFYEGEVVGVMGENGAGKSTLMKVLAGVHMPTSGDVFYKGEKVTIDSVNKASELGIAFIHQELNLSDNLSIGANIFLGNEPKKLKFFIDKKTINNKSLNVLKQLDLSLDPELLVKELRIGHQQMIEIAKAISQKAKMIIMDEPTSSLTQHETDSLLELTDKLRSEGCCIVFISHRLKEVERIADRVIVLRDGNNSGDLKKEDISHDAIVSLMVGRELESFHKSEDKNLGEVAMELKDVSVPGFDNKINMKLRTGEILGLSGLVGAGRTELAQAIFGIDPIDSGEIIINGENRTIKNVSDAITAGLGLVPEDRKEHGLILEFSIKDNIGLACMDQFLQKCQFIRKTELTNLANKMKDKLKVKTTTVEKEVGQLSGGNQQKVVLAKWLSTKPKVLILDEPTRGVDVMSKSQIYQLMEEISEQGVAILMISSDMEEVLRISDRILVMHEGDITGELEKNEFDEEKIMQLATGGNK